MSHTEKETNILISGIRVSPDAPEHAVVEQAKKIVKRAGLQPASLTFRLYKKSVDARHKDDVRLVCTVLAQTDEPLSPAVRQRLSHIENVRISEVEPLTLTHGEQRMTSRPLVVGMGPAGLFCALLLAENGYAPVLIDRGDCVADRVRAVERFSDLGVLDTDSNIQFGAGGAGTFSDGKLVTRISDPRCSYVLERLHDFGAPDEILTRAKPHVGTDVLREVVDRMLTRIAECGGEVHYRTRMDSLTENPDGTLTVKTNRGDMVCGALVLALGHSARDTYRMLISHGFAIEPKPMSIGVRIEHWQEDIDRALYGNFAGHPALGPAEYALSDTRSSRGVYTFCMCPGGQVVAAASEEGGVVVNGMSHHARDGKNANCAVAVSVSPSDYEAVDGNLALGAIAYQRAIEQAAFRVGGGDYSAPVQTVGDFMEGKVCHEPSRVQPTYRNGAHIRVSDISSVLPDYVTEGLRYGLSVFDRKIHGFAAPDAVLSAPETRTSAPVRILRGEQGTALGHERIYPCGEGAGYAGGITSAAVDGIKIAQAIMARYAPIENA
jgi:uncharacterized FAD-dependent dehydrogenase